MAIEVKEKIDSRGGDGTRKELRYIITGSDDHDDVVAALLASAPVLYGGLTRNDLAAAVDLIEGRTDIWEGRVQYEPQTLIPFQTGDEGFSFDTGGATQHITQSISTISTTAASGTASDFKGAIGFDGENVAGADIVVPQFNFSVPRYIATEKMTAAYIGTLYAMTGKVNNGTFSVVIDGETFTFAEGECLFRGVQGAKRKAQGDWELKFDFSGSPNRSSIAVGAITVAAKKGWEYLWVLYAPDTDNGRLVKTPIQANVEQVYETGDFSSLEPA